MTRSQLFLVAGCTAALTLVVPARGAGLLHAQATTPSAPAARPADVASLDAILDALYASISGPKGAPRDFDRMRSLLGPNARFIAHRPRSRRQGAAPQLVGG